MGCSCTKPGAEDTETKKQAPASPASPATAKKMQLNNEAAAGEHTQPPFPTDTLGTFSNHGIEPNRCYSAAEEAVVKANQDRGSVDYPFLDSYTSVLFCVMDGHGSQGDKVSEYCIHQLHDYLHDNKQAVLADPLMAFTKAYDTVDKTLLDDPTINSRNSGTSAVAVYMDGKTLYTANAGDSRAVIAAREPDGTLKASDLSIDQNPDSAGEYERINASGGIVTPPEEEGLSARVWTKDRTLGLSMARSLGDHELAKYGVIPTPVVTQRQMKPNDSVMILATDGIWEFITSQQAMDIVGKFPDDATAACRELILEATKRWRQEEGPYRDDITAIVIYLDKLFPFIEAEAAAASSGQQRNRAASCVANIQTIEEPDVGGGPAANSTAEEPADDVAVGPAGRKDKNFRRRRLSVDGDGTDAAKATALVNVQPAASGAAKPPAGRERKRRPSISPDMDPTGKKIEPC